VSSIYVMRAVAPAVKVHILREARFDSGTAVLCGLRSDVGWRRIKPLDEKRLLDGESLCEHCRATAEREKKNKEFVRKSRILTEEK